MALLYETKIYGHGTYFTKQDTYVECTTFSLDKVFGFSLLQFTKNTLCTLNTSSVGRSNSFVIDTLCTFIIQ